MYQLKIITTAAFFSAMLARRMGVWEWMTIIALCIGACMVESSQYDMYLHHANNTTGMICVLFAITTSGFAGVYFEKILKASRSSIWVLQVQLSIMSCIFGSIQCSSQAVEEITYNGFWYGYNNYTYAVVVAHALEGLAVAMVLRYADNIHKGFASSLSLIWSTILGAIIFEEDTLNDTFLIGMAVIVLSTTGFAIILDRQKRNPFKYLQPPPLVSVRTHEKDISAAGGGMKLSQHQADKQQQKNGSSSGSSSTVAKGPPTNLPPLQIGVHNTSKYKVKNRVPFSPPSASMDDVEDGASRRGFRSPRSIDKGKVPKGSGFFGLFG
jgi:UDP-galactose transporter